MDNIKINASDIRMSSVVKEVDVKEAERAIAKIMNETMVKKEWEISSCDMSQPNCNVRLYSSYENFEYIMEYTKRYYALKENQKNDFLFFILYFQGIPMGASLLELNTGMEGSEIISLVTHCAARGFGFLLIEFALNKLLQLGMNSRLKLEPVFGSIPAYTKMGFETSGGNGTYYYLDPAKRGDKWQFINGCYQYRVC
ncbi:N-acetyltransferase [Xenorhabdus mauleonii]|uniref:N-acetyltransferase n=2 Tax=Xenorhabdus mauleonii TaxID=351675 RepID=A0A1I3VNW7_9GAMM|nr:GNAT family N-acetyltransferase [Xenorhabdus mauleonii]PHM37407.1 N-acetyltransferase [Xenorhabdus mauleonii]SFJ95996.1 hypothetical protein SAMN05421680_12156 [Xenorhabdus mauleonii]